MKQVNKNHYKFTNYCGFDRWSSYFYQLREVIDLNPRNLLEVGVGDGVLKNYICNNTDMEYKNLDIAEDLKPNIVGNVENIPLGDDTFDLVCAFEILEHIPFDKFDIALSELNRVSKRDVIISLPHFGPSVRLAFKLPFLKEFKFAFKIPFYKKHVFNGEHYWEIGKKGYSTNKIRKVIKKLFFITNEFVPFENQYHHFFILRKK